MSRAPSRPSENSLSFYSAVIAAIIWLALCLGRWGFDTNSVAQATPILGMSFLLLTLPSILSRRIVQGRRGWKTSSGMLSLLVLAAVTIIVFFIHTPTVRLIVTVLGFLAFALEAGHYIRRGHEISLYEPLMVVLCGAALAGYLFGNTYHDPLGVENLFLGRGNIDTLFHAAVTGSYQTFGFASTALHGTPSLHAASGSHWWFAVLARYLEMSPLTFYHAAYPVVVVPLLIKGLTMLAHRFSRKNFDSVPRMGTFSWFVLFCALVGIFPLEVYSETASFNFKFISEPFVTALALAFFTADVAVAYFQEKQSAWLSFSIFGTAMMAAIGFCNAFVMDIAVVPLLAALWYFRPKREFVSMAPLLVVVVWLISTFSAPSLATQISFSPLDFPTAYTSAKWRPFFFFVHYFWTFVYLSWRILDEGPRTLGELISGFRDGLPVDVVLLVLISIAGAIPGLVWAIPDGNAIYFSASQQFVAVALLMAHASRAKFSPRFAFDDWRQIPLRNLIVAFAVLPLGLVLGQNFFYRLTEAAKMNIETRRDLILQSSAATERFKSGTFTDSLTMLIHEPVKQLNTTLYAPIVRELLDLQSRPIEWKKKTAIFVPTENLRFWSWSKDDCDSVPFLAPALSGMASVFGLMPSNCRLQYRGYESYDFSQVSLRPEARDRASLCAAATKLGFENVLVLNSGDKFDSGQLINCVTTVSAP